MKFLEDFLEKYIYLSGIRKTPKEFVREALNNFLLLAAASATLSLVVAVFSLGILEPIIPLEQLRYLAYLIPAPLIIGLFLLFEPYFRAAEHMRGAERELLYVMALLTTYAANGVAPHIAIDRLRMKYKELFTEFSKIAERISRIRVLFVVDELEAMEFEGRRVSSQLISDLLLSSASIERRGGDIYAVLREKMRSIFNAVRENYKTLSSRMSFVADVILIAYGVLPMMLYTMFALFASEELALQSIFYSFFVNPLIGLALVYLIDLMYPKTPVKYNKYYRLIAYSLPVGAAVFVAVYAPWYFGLISARPEVISGLPWTGVAIAAAAIATCAPAAFRYHFDQRRLTAIDYALPSFVRDVAEEVKKGSTPSLAIITLSNTRSYGSALDKVIKKIALALEAGRTFEEAVQSVMREVSWYCRMSLTLMVEADLMGAKPEVFDEVAEVTREIIDSLRIARSSVMPLKIFGLITAVLVIGITSMLVRQVLEPIAMMAEGFYAAASSFPTLMGSLGVQLITPKMLPQLVDTVITGSVVTMILMGLMTGKMTDGTLAGGFVYVIIDMLLSMTAILLLFLVL
ncbi:MAG: type II secretion system F family protein [Desulfurococcaceae archaeon]